MTDISTTDALIWELEGACEVDNPTVESLVATCGRAHTEILRLQKALDWSLDDPQIDDFMEAVKAEIQHQRKRWGKEHDHDKGVFDWVALAVRLQGKMVEAVWNKDRDKFLHHVITLAAVMGNCHAMNISKPEGLK